MITQSQISQIRSLCHGDPVLAVRDIQGILSEWENNLKISELSKNSDKFELTLTDTKNETVTVIATRIGKNFAFHKAVWGAKGFTVTHIGSGLSAFTSDRKKINAFIVKFKEHIYFKEMDDAWTDFDKNSNDAPSELQREFLNLCREARQ